MKKKSLASFLMFIMVISLALVGCSSKEKGTAEKDNSKPYEITMAYVNFTNAEELPLVQNEINKITKKKINATVKLMPIGAAAWTQQSTLLLSGNEKLDLIITSATNGYLVPAAKGQLLPLDNLLAKHGKGVLDTLPQHIIEGTRVNGKIYGVPSVREFANDQGFIMRKDIVDKYNIDLSQIKTFEDLGNVFDIVKKNEPNLTAIVNQGSLLTTVGLINGGKFDPLGDYLGVMSYKEKKIINMFEDPDYVKGVELARKWSEAGYTLKDAATTTDSAANIVKAGKGFGYSVNMKPGFETQETLATGMEMVAVRLTKPSTNSNVSTLINMSIARNSENPEKAMEFINLLYTDKDIMNLLANGIEGKHYKLNSDGTIKLIKGSKYVLNQWQIGNNALTNPYEGNSPKYWDEILEFNESAVVSPAIGFQFNPDPVKTEIAASTNVINQYKAALEAGALDPDKIVPEFNKKLKDAGLDKIIAEKQKQFDEWKKKN